jgi:hypothetical protein
MIACTVNRLDSVKALVRRGAKLFYHDDDDTLFSAVHNAKLRARLLQWLLVVRYTDQARLKPAANVPEATIKLWAEDSIGAFELSVQEQMRLDEPLRSAITRISRYKQSLRGEVVRCDSILVRPPSESNVIFYDFGCHWQIIPDWTESSW